MNEKGPADVATRPVILDNRQSCYVANIFLKGPGVPLEGEGAAARQSIGVRPRSR